MSETDQAIGQSPRPGTAERRRLLVEWNDTRAEDSHDRCIHELFEAQVAKTPNAVAVAYEDQSLTYGELNAQANRLAHHLRRLGVKPDARVALCAERSLDMVVGLSATLKAGGAFVPLDPSYPADRLVHMLADSAPVALLTNAPAQDGPRDLLRSALELDPAIPVLDLTADAAVWAGEPNINPDPRDVDLRSRHLAYVIYTSGSTGQPKGVMVEHRNVCNEITALNRRYGLGAGDRILQFVSMSFDVAVEDVLGSLTAGSTVVLRTDAWVTSASEFWALCKAHQISAVNLPAMFWEQLLQDGTAVIPTTVRQIVFGGDAVNPRSIQRWFRREGHRPRLFNAYGPTETTICASLYQCTGDEVGAPPIGRPIANTQIHLLDAHHQPVPVGEVGELYIGGAGVARGYLNRPGLTAERFLTNPFSDAPDARMYRTGDLGRFLPDGNIEFLGRNDQQVKVRGFRVELGEIEARLLEHPAVREAVVLAREDGPGDKQLVAYVTTAAAQGTSGARVDVEALRAHLGAALPEYMVPAAYVQLDALPLTPNGKLDRKALPVPLGDAYARRGYEAPDGEVENALAAIWAEVLKLDRVGRNDNFFELGGHSLLAVTVIERMRRAGLHADVRELFATPSLAALAASVGEEDSAVAVPPNLIPPDCQAISPPMLPLARLSQEDVDRIVGAVPGGAANVQDIYPLAPLQEGILFHHRLLKEGDPYLLHALFSFASRERLDRYVRAQQAVIDRHDILRTAVVWERLPEPVQVVWRRAPLVVEEIRLDAADGDIAQQLRDRFDRRHYRLDLRRAPLRRLIIAEDAVNGRWLGLEIMHHLAGDHTTLEVMQQEIQAHLLSREEELPSPLPFRNFVAQARLGVSREEHEAFFTQKLWDVEEPTAPFGLSEVQGDGSGTRETRRVLERSLCKRLRARARALGVSAASLFHLAWAQVLARVSGRDDVVFGTVLFGRMQAGEGADRALGLFINTLPLRIRVGDESARIGVQQTQHQLTDLLRHEHAPLVLAQRCSAVKAPAPLFTALLNYHHGADKFAADTTQDSRAEVVEAWSGIEFLGADERTSYPLSLGVNDQGEGFELTAEVQRPVEPGRICDYMQTALSSLAAALEGESTTPMFRLEVMPPAERRQLLVEWNDTQAEYSSGKCLQGLVIAQMKLTPGRIAIVDGAGTLTYRRLDQLSDRLAHQLRRHGVRPGDYVATLLPESHHVAIAWLGILKVGAAFMPLDVRAPPESSIGKAKKHGVNVIVTDERSRMTTAGWPGVTVSTAEVEADGAIETPFESVVVEALAPVYAIHTSGSTGEPKAVVIPHRGLLNRLAWMDRVFGSAGAQSVAQTTRHIFDSAVWQIFWPLINGGRSIVVDLNNTTVPEIVDIAQRHQVTTIDFVPSVFAALFAGARPEPSGSRPHFSHNVIFGGEELPGDVADWLRNEMSVRRIVNLYGPTEVSIGCISYDVTASGGGRIPIGRPISNTRAYVLDERGRPAPVGVAGELYLGGDGVALGYLGQPGLTAERFVASPFTAGDRLYRTGDLVRYQTDGNLVFLGRIDQQVKIRGFRIELGEIEAALLSHDSVKQAAVLAREDEPGVKRLVAYVVAKPNAALSVGELSSHLKRSLAEYLVPAAYVLLDALPVTAGGKLDRKALPAPTGDASGGHGYEAPVGEVESTLARIWAEVLKLERVGRHDNFFELGGHSLLAMTVIERMRRAELQADVRALFATPTLKDLASALGGDGGRVRVPPSLIPPGSAAITPAMLPLVSLSESDIARIVNTVPGGAPNVQDIYPLAPLQEGILFHHLMGGEGDVYLTQVLFGFESRGRLDHYLRALQAVIDRHDILRTAVAWEGLSEPVQVVWRRAPLVVEAIALGAGAGDVAQQLLARYDPRHYRIDVRQAPLMRLFIAQDVASGRWFILELTHHLAGDNTTLEQMRQEIQLQLLGRAEELPAPVPFRNFVAQARLGVSREEHEAFFSRFLGDVDEPTAPFGLVDVRGDGGRIAEARREADPALWRRLQACVRALGVSAASVCHLAWAQVLARVSGRDDVVFGTVMFGRMQGGEGADRALGLFINTLPVRIRIGDEGARESVRDTHQLLTQLLRHEHAPLALAQRCSAVQAPAPLFTALLNYRHGRPVEPANGGTKAEAAQAWAGMACLRIEERTNYPVTLLVDDLGERLGLTVQVDDSIDPERVCGLMHTALESLVGALERAPEAPLQGLDVLPAAERHRLLVEWNDTAADYPREACIHELIEAQVAKTPDAVAVVYEDQALSYGELNARANRLAHHLRRLGVGPDARVAICVERSLEMVVGLLGVLKAGGAYVPLDPAYPVERLAYMVRDSASVVLLTHAQVEASLRGRLREALNEAAGATPVLDLLADAEGWASEPDGNPDRAGVGLGSRHLAYVIYTSGSTGRPKGVMNEHRGVVNRLMWMQAAYALSASDAVLQKTSVSFDVSVWELFWPLLVGARLVMARPEGHKDPAYLVDVIQHARITTLHFVPSMLQTFLEQAQLENCSSLIRVVCSGEALPGSVCRRFRERLSSVELYNLYGPTEAAVDVTAWDCASGPLRDNTPIGRPIFNTRIYILDAHRKPAPMGVVGEIYIGGVQVARGYLNRPELTAERFLTDPFSDVPDARMYKTGDLGRHLPDGNIEFLGRNDHQVKIRGFRIELSEIEARLAEHPDVSEAVVLARDDGPGGKRLVAYLTRRSGVAASEERIDVESVRAHLGATLPEFMVPAAYVQLDALPLTPNGKLDRRALPAPEGDAYLSRGYAAPVGEVESVVAEIWAEVLTLDRVGRHDNFFELGGHSLLAVTVIERMRRAGLKADVRALFATPTLTDFAGTVGVESVVVSVPPNLIPEGCEAITPEMLPLLRLSEDDIARIVSTVPGGAENVQDIYPLTPLQEGILFHHLMESEGDPYVLHSLASFDTRERVDGYVRALQAVVDRHDVLRTAVVWEGLPEPVQVVWRDAPLGVEDVVLDPAAGDIVEQLRARYDARHHRLDVRRAPLMRLVVVPDVTRTRWLVLELTHHLVEDNTSLRFLHNEVQAYLLGRAEELPKPLPFRNFVAQGRLGVSREEHEAFFTQLLGDIEEPSAPFGLSDARGNGGELVEAHRVVDPALCTRLRARARGIGVSAACVCHLAWAQVLARASGREDVVFGTVMFGRMQGVEGTDGALGLFINTLPVRIRIGEEGAQDSVRHVHQLLTQLIRHEHAPLALAQRCSRVRAPEPLFTALLNYRHNDPTERPHDGGATGQSSVRPGVEFLEGEERTNYPINLDVDDLGEGLELTAQVDASIDPQRVCGMMHTALESLVKALESAPATPVRCLEVLPAAERHRLLVEWNQAQTECPADLCLHQLFEAQAAGNPTAVAVRHEDRCISYGDLNVQANRLAHHLRRMGVKPDARVAVFAERSPELVAGMLGALKAGGAYVPLDPAYPADRLAFLLSDCAPVVVLTDAPARAAVGDVLEKASMPVLDLQADGPLWANEPSTNPGPDERKPGPRDLAYVIYTSGSTGQPNGVMVEHRSACNQILAWRARFDLVAGDRVLQFASTAFDTATEEIFTSLASGATLVLRTEAWLSGAGQFWAQCRAYGITFADLPTLFWEQLLQDEGCLIPTCLRQVVIGGDAVSDAALARWFGREGHRPRLVNAYGPTEATITATIHEPGPDDTGWRSIGRPFAGSAAYILDRNRQPVPIGAVGELYIGGMGVARGYHNRARLTAERFLADPFRDDPEARIYKTGDLARHLPDGKIEFLGRNDYQIKLRGFRVELGEVEARLAEHPIVREAVVLAREDTPGDKRLVAYITTTHQNSGDLVGTPETVDVHALRAHLSEVLPEYMVPGAYVVLGTLPLTPSGKVDRRALPAPNENAFATRAYEAPVGKVETALAGIWGEVLKLERVGRHDNFFELGGHSLLAMTVIERMRRADLQADVRALFSEPSLASLARVTKRIGKVRL